MQQIICYSDCAIDKGSLILLLRLKRLYIFAMLDSLLIKQSFGKCLSATPTKRLQKMHWLDDHKNHVHQLTYTHFDTIIIDDLITAGLSPYSNAWETFFKELLNLGIVGDCTQHILFQVENYLFQATLNMSFTVVPTVLVRIISVKLWNAFCALPYYSKRETPLSK